MRTFAIGDVHGEAETLRRLVESVPIGKDDLLVTLGDYIDRGPDSCEVISYLINYPGKLEALKGNHEEMMLIARNTREALPIWMANGGGKTLDSYHAASFDDIPEAHWEFLGRCKDYYDGGDFFCVHAWANPDKDLKDQDWNTARWCHLDYWMRANKRLMVCGHTPQLDGHPLFDKEKKIACIDTGGFRTGWITCLEPETGHYWQASKTGFREGDLYVDK